MVLTICLCILTSLRIEFVIGVHILHTQSCTQYQFIPRISVLRIGFKVFLFVAETI